MGQAPDYWAVIQSARYLRVAPWDLAGLPDTAGAYCWIVWSVVCQEAEARAERQMMKHRQQTTSFRR